MSSFIKIGDVKYEYNGLNFYGRCVFKDGNQTIVIKEDFSVSDPDNKVLYQFHPLEYLNALISDDALDIAFINRNIGFYLNTRAIYMSIYKDMDTHLFYYENKHIVIDWPDNKVDEYLRLCNSAGRLLLNKDF